MHVNSNSSDPAAQCAPYNYQPATDLNSQFPTIWGTADLVSGDTEAAALFAQINATVNERLPGVVPNGDGSHSGSWGSSFSYPSSDPNCWWTSTTCTTPNSSTGIAADLTTMPEPETWGFGFDDGPNCSHNALYNFLQENDQKATMFYIGSNVMDWPIEAMRGATDGHHICVHTWSHQYMTSFSNQQAFAELYYTQRAIKDIVGVTPKCWRPPYGDVDNRIRLIASLLNMTTIVWDHDTNDWEEGTNGVTVDTINANYQTIIDKAKNGTFSTYGPIVLNHEIDNFTMQEMMDQYANIKAAFKYIVPIATGYNITHPYMEANITYPDFNEYIAGDRNVTTTSASPSASTVAPKAAAASNTSHASNSSSSSAAAASVTANKSAASAVLGVSLPAILFGAAVACIL